MRRRFLWAGDQEIHGGKCKVNWTRVCRPIKYEGLGITELKRFSRVLRLHCLWYKWKKPDKPCCSLDLPTDSTDEALFSAASKVTVRNGRTTSFWSLSWLNGLAPATLFPFLHKHSRRKNRTVREAMANDNWIRDLTPNLTLTFISDYVLLWELVNEAGYDPQEEEEDEIIWTRTF
jgi:hypothetical protein